jgi:predicted transcriptional regulator
LLVYAEKHGRRRYVYDIQRQKPLWTLLENQIKIWLAFMAVNQKSVQICIEM